MKNKLTELGARVPAAPRLISGNQTKGQGVPKPSPQVIAAQKPSGGKKK